MSNQPRKTRGRLRLALYNARRRLLGTIVSVATDEPVAALTFDDGPDPEFTPRLLAVLERHGARATFFMLGAQAAAHPALLARVAAGGHCVANHTFDHVRMPQTPRLERLRQLRRCRAALAPHGVRLFRPPYGGQNLGSRLDAMILGYDVVTWSAHVEDWTPVESGAMAEQLERRLAPGAIILLHDRLQNPRHPAAADRGPMIAAVDCFLGRVGDRFRFVTVPELLRRGRPVRQRWFREAL
jgi:peptidoglycan/xylan/chitin deacetylase (PgdA/CDA1 family)